MRQFLIIVILAFTVNGDPSSETVNGVYVYHKSKPGQLSSTQSFKCPADPITEYYPDPSSTSCTTYFLCHFGHAYPRRCRYFEAFYPEKKMCLLRRLLPPGTCTQPYECNTGKKNGRFPYPGDCTRYFICYYGQVFHYFCNQNYVFDPVSTHCKEDSKKAQECEANRHITRLPDVNHPGFHPQDEPGQ